MVLLNEASEYMRDQDYSCLSEDFEELQNVVLDQSSEVKMRFLVIRTYLIILDD